MMLRADGLDKAIAGICRQFGRPDVILYDEDKVIEILMEREKMDYKEAVEFFEFNIIGAGMGPETPAFYFKLNDEELSLIEKMGESNE